MPRSIPRQLALSYIALVVLCLSLAAYTLLGQVRHQLISRMQRDLVEEGQTAAALLIRNGPFTHVGEADRRLLGRLMITLSLDRIDIFDRNQHTLMDSAELPHGNLRGALPSAPASPDPQLLSGGLQTLVGTAPPLDPLPKEPALIPVLFVAVPLRDTGTMIMRRPLADTDLFLLALKRSLIYVGIVTVALAVLLSWLLSRHFTRPLQHLLQGAQQVAAGNLAERLDLHTSTEFEQLSNAFNRMTSALLEHERVRSQFLADASHELKTPLTSLKALTEALDRGALQDADKARAFVGYIQAELDRMADLVTDLLDLHKLESGEMPIRLERLDLAALVCDVAAQHRASIPGLELVTVDSLMVEADPHRIRQVIINLLDNARRATSTLPDPHVTIHMSGDCLTVEDNGPGIPQEELERIFDRFHRLDAGRARHDGGSGLGLSIARRIVTLHGGRIWAESPPQGGARFHLALVRVSSHS